LPTHTWEPSGVTATPSGRRPTCTVAVVRRVEVLMAGTESEFMSVTQAVLPSFGWGGLA